MSLTPDAFTSGFMVIHGNKPELLKQLLVNWFKAHPLPPLENETVLVQSNGIAQWLKLALATAPGASPDAGCGIAAAFDMLLPSNFMWRAYRAVLGPTAVADVLPFDKPLLIWRLMRLLPTLTHQTGYEPLAVFLQDDPQLRKRYQLADKIADLFDQYQVYRADWLDAWASGHDVLINLQGQSKPLASKFRWQALLWRALLQDAGMASHTSRAAVHQQFLRTLPTLKTRPPRLPQRVSVFGLSSLPSQSLEVLRGISTFTQVLLCVHNPCQFNWADVVSAQDLARRTATRHARKPGLPLQLSDDDLHLHAHPLLASWGKQGRDYIRFVDEADTPDDYRPLFQAAGHRIDLFEAHADSGPGRLLNQLQDDILNLRPVQETRAQWPAVDPQHDRSVRFHVVHSIQREVEVLHDQLLAAFNADDTLHPRDVIVMVPDVNQYAPHIEAVFGLLPASDPRHIPFSIADKSQRHQSPVAFALEFLLSVSDSRLAVSQMVDLLDVPAVRQRFGLDAGSLPLLRRWIQQAHIRWGLDARHRQPFMGDLGNQEVQAGQREQNTWMQGLKRMLLGYAVGSDPTQRTDRDWHGIEPLAEVAGLDAALVGPLDRLLRALESWMLTVSQPATPAVWGQRLQALMADFLHSEAPQDAALLLQLHNSLQQWLQACEVAQLQEELPLSVVRDHWLTQLDQPHLAQRFMGGQLTFATLMPMRAIPFRMVCLLGMADGEFPRARPPLDFDLMARDLRPGDRSRREDDRYLFLEALLSARERLHISWVGKSIQDNAQRPPSVLVSQLRDHIAAGWTLHRQDDPKALLQALTVEHPLQAFSPQYFGTTPDNSALFTYAREWECQPSAWVAPPSRSSPLPPAVLDQAISLKQLGEFLKHPVKTFYRERLHITLDHEGVTSDDHETFALDALQAWSLQNELIQARHDAWLRGEDDQQAMQRQLARITRRGDLPMGNLAQIAQDALTEPLDAMFELYQAARAQYPVLLEDVVFNHEWIVDGQCVQVQGVLTQRMASHTDLTAAPEDGATGPESPAWHRIELSSSHLLKDNHYRLDALLPAWVMHLAAHVSGSRITTEVIGKNGKVTLRALDPAWARLQFDALIDHYLRGLSYPLPLATKTGFAWLGRDGSRLEGPLASAPLKAVKAAQEQYDPGYNTEGESQQSPYLFRTYPSFAALWSEGEFSQLCDTLYAPLRACVGQPAESA